MPTDAAATVTESWIPNTRHKTLQQRSDQEAAKDLDPIYNTFHQALANI